MNILQVSCLAGRVVVTLGDGFKMNQCSCIEASASNWYEWEINSARSSFQLNDDECDRLRRRLAKVWIAMDNV